MSHIGIYIYIYILLTYRNRAFLLAYNYLKKKYIQLKLT